MPPEVLLVLWLAFAAVPAIVAVRRGRIFVFWFILALLLSPLIALIILLVMRNLRAAEDMAEQQGASGG